MHAIAIIEIFAFVPWNSSYLLSFFEKLTTRTKTYEKLYKYPKQLIMIISFNIEKVAALRGRGLGAERRNE